MIKIHLLRLKILGINEIIDGYGLMPYTENQIKFIPQLFYKFFALPFGSPSYANTFELLETKRI